MEVDGAIPTAMPHSLPILSKAGLALAATPRVMSSVLTEATPMAFMHKAATSPSEWAARVMEEFFQQGEEEARMGLPVSPFMDRAKTDIGQCQAGFISILIKPFFDEWTQFLGESASHIFANIESNIKVWKEQGEAALGERAAELKTPPKRK